jgi:hypothetical protein
MSDRACPNCGVTPDAQALRPWGDGQQTLPVAPWICASCGALAIIELATGRLQPTTDDMWAVVRLRNPVLWAEIQRVRAAIKAQQDDVR